jgi:hypothetical protein
MNRRKREQPQENINYHIKARQTCFRQTNRLAIEAKHNFHRGKRFLLPLVLPEMDIETGE